MKSNADKFHLLVSANSTINIKIGNIDIANNTCEKLLEVLFDQKILMITFLNYEKADKLKH